MKILYLITKSNFGGAQRYVYDLATEARKRGHDVVVGLGGRGVLMQKLEEAGVRTITLPELERDVNVLADIKTFFALFDIFSTESPDVVHLNSSKMGGLGALAARIYNAYAFLARFLTPGIKPMRIIFTGHGWAFNEERNDLERFLLAIAHWCTIELAHKTIAVSRKTRDQVSALPFAWHKVNVIHNGVGPLSTLPRDQALSEILDEQKEALLREHPLIVGTLAELHKNKGLSYAIEGLAQLKKQTSTPVLFLVLGEGEERVLLQELIAKHGLEQSVFLAGDKENGALLLSAFDIFLLPSITEAFPYAILEAGNAGLPVIATAVGGIPEVVDDMQSGILIQSKNPSEIARAISYLISYPDRRHEFAYAIKKRIEGRFNLEHMVEETLELYKTQ